MKKAKQRKLTKSEFGNILGLYEYTFGQFESSSTADQLSVVMARIVERRNELNLWLYFALVINDAAEVVTEVVTPDGTVCSVPRGLTDLAIWLSPNNLSADDEYYFSADDEYY